MDKLEIIKKIQEEVDYVRCPKCQNSLTKFMSKNPDGVDDATIARLLLMPEEQVKELYEKSIKELRLKMGEE